MSDKQASNPLHGITLESLLSELVSLYGWQGLAERLPINCFSNEPSIKSSLSFLRRTSWARQKVEALYLASQDDSLQHVDAEPSSEPRTIMSRPQASGKKQGERRPRQGYGTDRAPRADGDRPQGERSSRPYGERGPRRDGDRPQGERSSRPYGDRPQGERGPRRDGDRPQGERSSRSYGDRPQGERSSRPYGDRPQGERGPRRDGDRPQTGNRPYRDHAQGTDRLFRNEHDPVQQERAMQQQEAQRRQGGEPKDHRARSGERQHGRDHQHARAQHHGQASSAPRPAKSTEAKSPWGIPKKKEQDAE